MHVENEVRAPQTEVVVPVIDPSRPRPLNIQGNIQCCIMREFTKYLNIINMYLNDRDKMMWLVMCVVR